MVQKSNLFIRKRRYTSMGLLITIVLILVGIRYVTPYLWGNKDTAEKTVQEIVKQYAGTATTVATQATMTIGKARAIAHTLEYLATVETVKAEFTESDLNKLTRIIKEPGALLTDLKLLQWALNALNRFSGEIADAIRDKVCEAVPELCGGQARIVLALRVIAAETSVYEIGLTDRVANILRSQQVNTAGELARRYNENHHFLDEVHGFGAKALEQIENFLREHIIQ